MFRISQFHFYTAAAFVLLHSFASAASKPHAIAFGKWMAVPWSPETVNPENEKPSTIRVRAILIDARIKEYTLGASHEITDRLFVIRRAFRVNDSLPQELNALPHWRWQVGGWLLVDRSTGHIASINLPEFDATASVASWYRDYVAYCGVSDDGKRIDAVVAQVSRHKAIFKKALEGQPKGNSETRDAPAADFACPAPVWQRDPSRVSFEINGSPKQTFAIRRHSVDLLSEEQDDEEAAK